MKTYRLTPKGAIDNDEIYNSLILYMYKASYNGIVLNKGELHFITLKEKKNELK